MRKFLVLIFVILLGFSLLPAVVSEYNFASSIETYTPITDGTVLGTPTNDGTSFNALPLGFDFVFDANVVNAVSVNTDGFVVFGPTAQQSSVSISNSNVSASNRLVAAMNRDLKGKTTTGSLTYKTIGTSPDQVFVVQWTNYQRYGAANAGDSFEFQVRIYETSNVIKIHYGQIIFGNSSLTSNTFQVGLRGNSNSEFFNRSVIAGTNDWLTSVPGAINTASCAMSPTLVPASGLTYQYTPPVIGDPPNAAHIGTPVDMGVDVLLNAPITWSDGGGGPTGYKVFLGTDNPPSNLVNGAIQGLSTTFTPANPFTYSTVYYWQIIPFNQFGEADSCLVWSFTTLADPSIVSFPYNEGFESAYFPPLGWTSTGWVRGSASHSGTYCARDLYQPAGTRILMTPRLEVAPEMRLKFWWRDSDISKVVAHDTTYCEISTNGGANWTTLAVLSTAAVETAYHQAIIDIGAYASTNARLRWRDVTDGTLDAYGVGLDDISISLFTPVYNPPTNLTHVDGNNSVVLNWTAATIADGMTLSGYKIYRDTALIFTTASAAVTYTDNTVTNGMTYSYYVTASYINPAGESIPTNTISAAPLAPVFDAPSNLVAAQTGWNTVGLSWLMPSDFESFEGTFPPTGWTQTVTNTDAAGASGVLPTWSQVGIVNVVPQIIPHGGNKQVGLWLSFAHQNEWLMTPQFLCPASASLSFWSYVTQGSTDGDHFYVKVSPNNGASWNTLWDASALPPMMNAYATPYTISLAAYAGQNIKIAWQAVDGPSMEGLYHVWFIDQMAAISATTAIYFNAEDLTVRSSSLQTPPLSRSLTGVKVYRNGTLLQTIANPLAHQYNDTPVTPGTYVYKVTCYYANPTGESVYSNESSVTIAPYVFNPPTSFTAVAGNAQAILNWAAPTSGTPTGYKVYRNSTVVATLAANVLTYTNTGLTNGTPYDFWVTATYTSPTGESAATATIIVTPIAPTPTNLVGTIMEGNDVHLTWNAPAAGRNATKGKTSLPERNLLGYRVYKGSHAIQDIMNPAVLTYDVLDLMNGSYTFSVTALYSEGESGPSNVVSIVSNEDPVNPVITALKGNYPNPFNPTTVISYSIKNTGNVSLEIYNAMGQKVKTLVNDKVEAGNHTVTWNGDDDKGRSQGSGLYFYKMKSGNFSSTKKMILLK